MYTREYWHAKAYKRIGIVPNRPLSTRDLLKEARLVGGAAAAAIGVRAWCVARSGLGMETEYVSFQRPQVAAVKMTRGPALFGSFAGSWRFKTVAPDTTRVVFRYHVTARPYGCAACSTRFSAWCLSATWFSGSMRSSVSPRRPRLCMLARRCPAKAADDILA